jgi:hypothetical protein
MSSCCGEELREQRLYVDVFGVCQGDFWYAGTFYDYSGKYYVRSVITTTKMSSRTILGHEGNTKIA